MTEDLQLRDILQEDSYRQRSASQGNSLMQIEISQQCYELMDREFKCPICKSIYLEGPKWLPCQHVFCNQCLQRQITREKTSSQLCRCAECKLEFSHRNLKENKKFNRLLEVWRLIRHRNDLNTQIPKQFKAFDP